MARNLLCLLFIPIFIFTFFSNLFASPTGNIKGYVLDQKTAKPLVGANVYLDGTSMGASTDLNGKFEILNVPAGEYLLIANYVGYHEKKQKVKIEENKTVKLVIYLSLTTLEGEVIEVTAQAEGQMAAINQQISAKTIKNVVSAARIQELPDANAAESVGRLPGVSLLRSGGEGNKVVIRGMSPKYNAITVNGVKMASTGSGDRSTDISMISPFLLQGVEVIKAITPDQDADVIGGTVNFTFKKAPAGKKGFKLDGIVQGGYNGLEDAYGDGKFVLGASNRFFNQKLGVFAQVDIEKRNRSADQLNVGYDIINPSLKTWDKVVAQSATFQKVSRIRNRYGASLIFDYQFDNGVILFNNFANSSRTPTKRQRETFNSANNKHSYSISDSDNELTLMTNALNLEYNIGNSKIEAVLAHSFAENKLPLNLSYTFEELSAFTNATGLTNPFNLVDSAKNNIENTYLTSLSANNRYTKENQYSAALNMEVKWNLSKSISSRIKYGVKYRYKKRVNNVEERRRDFQPYRYCMDSIRAHFPWMNEVDVGSAVREKLPYQLFIDPDADTRKFLDGQFVFGPRADFDLLHDVYNMLLNTPDDVRKGLNGAPLLWKDWPNSIRDDYKGHENYSAAYILSEFNFGEKFMLMPGVRYERNSTTYTASRGDDAQRAEEGYNYHDTTMTRVNNFWLPMVHARYKATSWLDFRFAYTNTLARPNYNRITPYWHLNTNSGLLAYHNYRLKPARATNFDFTASIYENYVGFFNLALFYKKIKDLVYFRVPWSLRILKSLISLRL